MTTRRVRDRPYFVVIDDETGAGHYAKGDEERVAFTATLGAVPNGERQPVVTFEPANLPSTVRKVASVVMRGTTKKGRARGDGVTN